MVKKCRINNWFGELTCLLAGIILTTAFVPFNLFPVAIFAAAFLLFAILNVNPLRAALRGLLFGIGFFCSTMYWVYVSMHHYGDMSPLLSGTFTFLLAVILSVERALTCFFVNRLFKRNTLTKMILAFPALWIFFEWVRDWLFTGLPWLLIGYSQINSPLRGYAPVFSVYGVSLAVLICSGALVYLLTSKHDIKRFFSLIIIAIVFSMGSLLNTLHWTHDISKKPITVGLVQGNVPVGLKWNPDQITKSIGLYEKLSATLKSNIIFWPETAINAYQQQIAPSYFERLERNLKKNNSALVTGIPTTHNGQYFNSLKVFGNGTGEYNKKHLVPFGEYTPMVNLLGGMLNLPMDGFTHGAEKQANLIASGYTISPFVCYEVIFPELVRESLNNADLLLTASDDAWFGDTLAPHQHLLMAQMRSLETGRYQIFVTNSGVTAIINAQGHITGQLPTFTTDVLRGKVYPVSGTTPWVCWGMWPIWILIISFLLIAWRNRKG